MTRDRMTITVLALGVVVAAALSLFALILVDTRRSDRGNIEGRLRDRAKAGATLISSVFQASAATGRGSTAARYGGARVRPDVLARQARDGANAFLLVARPDGTVLAAAPGLPGAARTRLAGRPAWFRAAAARPILSVSNAGDSLVPRTLTFAQAFPAADGSTRILVSGSDPRLLSQFFAASLRQLPAVRGARTYLLDRRGAVLASPGMRARLGAPVPEDGVLDALTRRGHGNLSANRYYAASVIAGTPWRVVIVAPRGALFASIGGIRHWGPWALFGAFALAALTAIALVARAFRDAARIGTANAQLERATDVLEERAVALTGANRRLERVNGELARSNAELERFASIASHDLREPLRKVQMFSERVIHHESDNLSDRGRDYLGRMDTAAARMQTLIDGLLTYARVTTRPQPLEDVDLGQVAREVADDLDVIRRECGGRIEVGALPHVSAEPLRIRQLLQNLISNALHFHREDVPPVVRITGAVDGDDVVLDITDNGIGFEARHADRVFELFGRLHPRTAYPGTGMGLALCRRIVERHGGSIAVSSTPGQGSTFTVRLPRTPAADDVPPPALTEGDDPRFVAF